jgi:tRNA-splicing ligase RtcB (3'-phosphate/5'-hydroxy nucleic acid ligase)
MGTRSYVVEGKGNALALNSSPHGRRTDAFLDEIPGAYKDVDVVMADAADLVEVNHTLRQIVNVKGD